MKLWGKILIIAGVAVFCIGVGFGIFYFYVNFDLEIKGDKEIVINLNDEYKELGARAFILGKDVSDDINVIGNVDNNKVGDYEIRYYISNRFVRNDNYAVRYVKVIDNIGPEIKLVGGEVSLFVGDRYVEPGYSALDNYDGDITDRVVVTNNIDVNKVGDYEVNYLVEDSSFNEVEVKRVVHVKERPVVNNSSNGKGNGIAVLMYHFFYDESKGETGADSNWMEISAFDEQLKYLDENDYYFPTWSELADFVDGKISLPKKSIVITVDDGDESFFRLAVPIINKYDVKVTSFIVTSWTPVATLEQYRSNKINFQTHTHDMHKGGCSGGHGGLFRCIDYDKGIEDLSKSVQILGSGDAIAYPFGDVTDNVLSVTNNVGIKLGFTTKYGKVYKGMKRLELPRIRMSKGISLKGFINSI